MSEPFSNVTPEEMEAHKAKLEKRRTCPHCGADRDKMMRMHSFEQSIIEYLRLNEHVRRDSCIACVQKHVGKAMVLHKELLTATETNNVNIQLNHLEIIGNLQAATDEAQEWPPLHVALDAAEREYRYRGVGPNWEELARLIQEVVDAQPATPEAT